MKWLCLEAIHFKKFLDENDFFPNAPISKLFNYWRLVSAHKPHFFSRLTIMKIMDNPFYILGVPTSMSVEDMNDKVEDLILSGRDEETCQKAASTLGHPLRRLEAELSWFPGLSIKDLVKIYKTMIADWDQALPQINSLNISNLAVTNLQIETMRVNASRNMDKMMVLLESLIETFEDIDWDMELDTINSEREEAMIPLVETNEMDKAVAEYRKFVSNFLNDFIKKMDLDKRTKFVTHLAEDYTMMGRRECPTLIVDIVNNFEKDVLNDLEKCQEIVRKDCEELNDVMPGAAPNEIKSSLIRKFKTDLERWDKYAQPMQVVALSKGLAHESSTSFGEEIRIFYMDLWKKGCDENHMKELLSIIDGVFAEVNTISDRIKNDIADMEKIIFEKQHPEIAIREVIKKFVPKSYLRLGNTLDGLILFNQYGFHYEGGFYKDGIDVRYEDIDFIAIIGGTLTVNGHFLLTYPHSEHERLVNYIIDNLVILLSLKTMLRIMEKTEMYGLNMSGEGVYLEGGMLFFKEERFFPWNDTSIDMLTDGSLLVRSISKPKFKHIANATPFMAVAFIGAHKALSLKKF